MIKTDKTKTENNNNEIKEQVVQLRRVSKKTTGGSTVNFTALVVVGDKNGTVGTGYGKGKDVSSAIAKAVSNAKRHTYTISLKEGTIAHDVENKYGSAKVKLMPAPKGTGIIAGGAVRTVVELAGIKDISAKMLGSSNKICNIRCTIEALLMLKK